MSNYFFHYNSHSDLVNNFQNKIPNVIHDCEHMHYNYEEENLYSILLKFTPGLSDLTGSSWDHYDSYIQICISPSLRELFNTNNETEINRIITKFHNKYYNSNYGPIDLLYFNPLNYSGQNIGILIGTYNRHDEYNDFTNITTNYNNITYSEIDEFPLHSFQDNNWPLWDEIKTTTPVITQILLEF